MKRLSTLALFAFIFCTSASAQLGKGQKMIGGSIAAMSDKQKHPAGFGNDSETTQTDISINPQIAFGVGGNWMIGIKPGYSFGNYKVKSASGNLSESERNAFSIAAYARKFHPFSERFGIFGQAEAGYGFGKTTYMPGTVGESATKFSETSVLVKPGAYFKAGRRFIIEATVGNIGYIHGESKPDVPNASKSTNNRIVFSLSNSLSLGFHVVL